MEEEVKQVLDEIRPALQADGGDVELVGIEDDEYRPSPPFASIMLLLISGELLDVQYMP